MDRDQVFDILSKERDYQIKQEDQNNSHIVSTLNMGGILSAIQYNLNKANDSWYQETEPYPTTSSFLRKIGALCVKAGEDYGMKERT